MKKTCDSWAFNIHEFETSCWERNPCSFIESCCSNSSSQINRGSLQLHSQIKPSSVDEGDTYEIKASLFAAIWNNIGNSSLKLHSPNHKSDQKEVCWPFPTFLITWLLNQTKGQINKESIRGTSFYQIEIELLSDRDWFPFTLWMSPYLYDSKLYVPQSWRIS